MKFFSSSVKSNVNYFSLRKKKKNWLPNTNDKNSREVNAIFKFLGGYRKQWWEKNKLKFLKMAFDSNPFYLAACVNVTALCKVAVQSTLWCENERWPRLERKEKHIVSKRKCTVRSDCCGNKPRLLLNSWV